MRLAAIDIGTNTVRLLIADMQAGRKTDVARRSTITRLGQGVDEAGVFSPEAVVRTLEALAEYADLMGSLGVEASKVVATSAARDAGNSEEFIDAAAGVIETDIEVISGETEARYAFLGATDEYPFAKEDAPVLVFDVGGGSTELIAGHGRTAKRLVSLGIGSVRGTELYVRSDPPCKDELGMISDWARQEVKNGLEVVKPDLDGLTVIGVAGTVTTIKAVRLGLIVYDPIRIHLSTLTKHDIDLVLKVFLSMTLDGRRQLAGLEPKRADVIIAGTIITAMLLDELGVDKMTISEHDIIDGVLLTLAREQKTDSSEP